MKHRLFGCLLLTMIILNLLLYNNRLTTDLASKDAINENHIFLVCDGPDGVMIQ